MENNDYNQQEFINQDTIIEEPWEHQFEQEDTQSTRLSRHQSSGSSLYTKIMFTVFFLIILAVGVWAVLKGTNILGGTSQQGSTTPAVPKLVLQSQTTQPTTVAQTSAATTVTTTTRAVETTQAANTQQNTQNNIAYQEGSYTIVAGDSASRIAAAHNMTLAEFYTLNGFTEQTVLLPGNTVRVSGGTGGTTTTNHTGGNTETNSSTGEYVIKSGDSIYSIAEAHGMSMSEFKQLNGLTDDSLLLPGQVVKVAR